MATAIQTMTTFANVMQMYSNDATVEGTTVIEDAVRRTTHFSSLQNAIDNFINDTTSTAVYSDVNERLKNVCGIVIGAEGNTTADTGAISGSNVGGSTTKTPASIVPETADLTNLSLPAAGSTTTHTYIGADGQTFTFYIKWPESFTKFYDLRGINSWDAYSALSATELASRYVETSTVSSLTDSETAEKPVTVTGSQIAFGINTMIKGLYNFWLTEGLKLGYDSYGLDFNGKTVEIKFAAGGDYVTSFQAATRAVENTVLPTNNIEIMINSATYAVIDPADQNGNTMIEGGQNQCYFDRTIAHELIHALMQGKGILKNNTPEFFAEGSAEMVHGLDDYYSNNSDDILRLAQSYDQLNAAMPLTEGTGTNDRYISGYMFLHYLCQQNVNYNTGFQFGNSTSPVDFNYSGNTNIISYYKSADKIKYTTDFTGLSLVDDDLILCSSSGNLYLRNVRDQIVNVADSAGNVTAYGYMASGAGAINGGIYDKFEAIIGADNASNTITAGSGGAWMWGGAGSTADTLIGGAGSDVFYYLPEGGADIIQNAAANDSVNLNAFTLANITSAEITDGGVNLTFNDGGTLAVSGQAGSFLLGGQTYHANYQDKTWSL